MASQMTETLRNRTLFEVWLHLLFAVPSSPQSQIMIVEWRHSQTVIVKQLRTSLLSKRDLMPENDSAKNQTEYNSELTQKSNYWCISSHTLTIWWVSYSCLAIDFCATDLYQNLTVYDEYYNARFSEQRCHVVFFKSWLVEKAFCWNASLEAKSDVLRTQIFLGLADLFTSGYLKDDRFVKFLNIWRWLWWRFFL